MIISSQRYRNEEIIEEKRTNQDLDNQNPEYIILSVQECDAVQLLNEDKIEDFLNATYIDSPYYDISSGYEIW